MNPAPASGEAAGEPAKSGDPASKPGARPSLPLWLRLVPYVLSAVLFLSAAFTVFAPLPLLFLYFRAGRRQAWLAALVNSAIIYFAGGPGSQAVYLVFIAALALPMAECLRLRKSPDVTVALTLLLMGVSGAVCVGGYSAVYRQNPWQVIRQNISEGLDHIAKSVEQTGGKPWIAMESGAKMEPAEIEEWKASLLSELPSAVAVIALVLAWVNLLVLLRANPGGVRTQLGLDPLFFQTWKAPELLVWPTILAGVFLLFEVRGVSIVALNLFKFLMAIYAIQGLGILSFFFTRWRIGGGLRVAGFIMATFLMMPLLLSLGFFDLWFDFRAKFRQS